MRNVPNFIENITEEFKRIEDPNTIVGKGSLMPHNAACSGPRKDMHSVQVEHIYPLFKPEVPYHLTGRENEFARFSSAFKQNNESDYYVIAKIDKFSFKPGYHYYLIIQRLSDGVLDIIERKKVEHVTETYGYVYNNSTLDKLQPGSTVPRGTTLIKTTSYDEFDNRADGINLRTGYISNEGTKEDAIMIREGAAEKFVSPEICKVQFIINDNDIMINTNGDKEFYMSFPNVGDKLKSPILAVLRKEQKNQSLYTLTTDRLQHIMMSDEKYIVPAEDAEVVDINLYCNNIDLLQKSQYNAQLLFYNQEKLRCAKEIVEILQPLRDQNYKFTPDLQKLLYINKCVLEGKQYMNDRVFSNAILEITILERNKLNIGDKLANRYGGKGCISMIVPDELMPMAEDGKPVDILLNTSGVPNRENLGQSFELEINRRAEQLLNYIKDKDMNPVDALYCIHDFLDVVCPKMNNKYDAALMQIYEMDNNLESYSNYDMAIAELALEEFLTELKDDDCLYTVVEPITETASLETLDRLDNMFPQVFKRYKTQIPIRGSNGQIRYTNTRKPVTFGYEYFYRLKQYAKEKSSVTSLCSTNLRNLPSRNNNKKAFKTMHSTTPIAFANMETADLGHIGMEHVIVNMMLNSSSPIGRRANEVLLTGDPYNIDVELPDHAKNRGAEILNAYLLTIGLEVKFIKKPKKYKAQALVRPLEFGEPVLRQYLVFDVPGNDDVRAYVDKLEAANRMKILVQGLTFDED